jgi:hypothetical protein
MKDTLRMHKMITTQEELDKPRYVGEINPDTGLAMVSPTGAQAGKLDNHKDVVVVNKVRKTVEDMEKKLFEMAMVKVSTVRF